MDAMHPSPLKLTEISIDVNVFLITEACSENHN